MDENTVPQPKFHMGQKVMYLGDGEVGSITGISSRVITEGDESVIKYFYTMTSREVDVVARKVLKGVKNCSEDELEPAEDHE